MAATAQTPKTSTASNPPSLKKSTSGSQSSMSQKSIASFFPKRSVEGQAAKVNVPTKLPNTPLSANGMRNKPLKPARELSQSLTPAPSSDAVQEEDIKDEVLVNSARANGANGLPSPITPASGAVTEGSIPATNGSSLKFDSPSRKVRQYSPRCEVNCMLTGIFAG